MAVITTTSLNDSLPKFIAEAKLTLKQEGLMESRVKKVTLGRGQGLTFNLPTWTGVSVLDLTQGVDLAQAQSVTDTNFAVTVSEKGGQVFFSDLTEMALREDVMRSLGKQLANAYKNSWNVDLTEQMDSASVSLGGAGTTLNIGNLQSAAMRLSAATRPVEGKLSCVIHPYQYMGIAQDLAGLTNGSSGASYSVGTPSIARGASSLSGMSEEIIRKLWVGHLAGVDVFIDNTIAIDGSTDAKGGMFAEEAIYAVKYEEPSVRTQRDESLRGVELNYVGVQGAGVYESTWMFELYSDAPTPD